MSKQITNVNKVEEDALNKMDFCLFFSMVYEILIDVAYQSTNYTSLFTIRVK